MWQHKTEMDISTVLFPTLQLEREQNSQFDAFTVNKWSSSSTQSISVRQKYFTNQTTHTATTNCQSHIIHSFSSIISSKSLTLHYIRVTQSGLMYRTATHIVSTHSVRNCWNWKQEENDWGEHVVRFETITITENSSETRDDTQTTDHATDVNSHDWQPFIPCDGGTGMEQSSTFTDCVQKTTENFLVW